MRSSVVSVLTSVVFAPTKKYLPNLKGQFPPREHPRTGRSATGAPDGAVGGCALPDRARSVEGRTRGKPIGVGWVRRGVSSRLQAEDGETGEVIRQVQSASYLLDESIELPGGYRIGWDPIIGILPVLGDIPTSAVSAYIIMEAIYLGVPKPTLVRMVANLLLDATVGSLPAVGPVFDAVWKANARNVALLEARVDEPASATRDRRLFLAIGAGIFLLVAGVSIASGLAVAWLAGRLGIGL